MAAGPLQRQAEPQETVPRRLARGRQTLAFRGQEPARLHGPASLPRGQEHAFA